SRDTAANVDVAAPSPDAGGTTDATSAMETQPPNPDAATPVDANPVRPEIFYLDVGGRVMTAEAENPAPRTLVMSAGQGPDGIAVDLAAGHIFWTTMGVPADDDGSVRRSNLDGTN